MPHDKTPVDTELDPAAIAGFLRRLAKRVERDPEFGRAVAAVLVESGLLAQQPARRGTASAAGGTRTRAVPRAGAAEGDMPPMDPFAVLRQRGEAGLRADLRDLDVPAMRQLVRAHRLDPARISARWTNRERLIALIVDQVRARADHGKAFARI